MSEYRSLTNEEMNALRAFAEVHGRGWKKDLSEVYWHNARIWRDTKGNTSAGHYLHTLRNDLGPSWLAQFQFPKTH